jgi:hypothetical protein
LQERLKGLVYGHVPQPQSMPAVGCAAAQSEAAATS